MRAAGIIFLTPDKKALFLKRSDDGTKNVEPRSRPKKET